MPRGPRRRKKVDRRASAERAPGPGNPGLPLAAPDQPRADVSSKSVPSVTAYRRFEEISANARSPRSHHGVVGDPRPYGDEDGRRHDYSLDPQLRDFIVDEDLVGPLARGDIKRTPVTLYGPAPRRSCQIVCVDEERPSLSSSSSLDHAYICSSRTSGTSVWAKVHDLPRRTIRAR